MADAARAVVPGNVAVANAPASDALVVDAPASDAPANALAIVDAPMAWSAERERLTLAYRRQHNDPDATDLTIDPRVIVLHYTAGGSAAATRHYFDNVRIEAARKE